MGQFQQQLAGVASTFVRTQAVGTNVFGKGEGGTDLTKLPSFKSAKVASGSDAPDAETAANLLNPQYNVRDEVATPGKSLEDSLNDYDAIRQFQYEAKLMQDRAYTKQLFALMALGGNS